MRLRKRCFLSVVALAPVLGCEEEMAMMAGLGSTSSRSMWPQEWAFPRGHVAPQEWGSFPYPRNDSQVAPQEWGTFPYRQDFTVRPQEWAGVPYYSDFGIWYQEW